jgi:hypothetical protein
MVSVKSFRFRERFRKKISFCENFHEKVLFCAKFSFPLMFLLMFLCSRSLPPKTKFFQKIFRYSTVTSTSVLVYSVGSWFRIRILNRKFTKTFAKTKIFLKKSQKSLREFFAKTKIFVSTLTFIIFYFV